MVLPEDLGLASGLPHQTYLSYCAGKLRLPQYLVPGTTGGNHIYSTGTTYTGSQENVGGW